jgi:hypothetical protein
MSLMRSFLASTSIHSFTGAWKSTATAFSTVPTFIVTNVQSSGKWLRPYENGALAFAVQRLPATESESDRRRHRTYFFLTLEEAVQYMVVVAVGLRTQIGPIGKNA